MPHFLAIKTLHLACVFLVGIVVVALMLVSIMYNNIDSSIACFESTTMVDTIMMMVFIGTVMVHKSLLARI